MAILPQMNIFSWKNMEVSSDLDRLQFVLQALPDEKLMRKLEIERGKGRDDYPVRALFNSIIAGVVYQHPSIESLRRELLRNGELRELCGFNLLLADEAVPPSWVYTRFFKIIFRHSSEVDKMFDH